MGLRGLGLWGLEGQRSLEGSGLQSQASEFRVLLIGGEMDFGVGSCSRACWSSSALGLGNSNLAVLQGTRPKVVLRSPVAETVG